MRSLRLRSCVLKNGSESKVALLLKAQQYIIKTTGPKCPGVSASIKVAWDFELKACF